MNIINPLDNTSKILNLNFETHWFHINGRRAVLMDTLLTESLWQICVLELQVI